MRPLQEVWYGWSDLIPFVIFYPIKSRFPRATCSSCTRPSRLREQADLETRMKKERVNSSQALTEFESVTFEIPVQMLAEVVWFEFIGLQVPSDMGGKLSCPLKWRIARKKKRDLFTIFTSNETSVILEIVSKPPILFVLCRHVQSSPSSKINKT